MFEAMVKSGDVHLRDAALRSMAIDSSMRSERVSRHATMSAARITGGAATSPHKQRLIYTCNHGTTLPGMLVRSEGQPASSDVAVNEAYDGLGATFDLYWDIFKRNSIDNAGMNLLGSVHYGNKYNNAFWDGVQMAFGDGDGVYFNRFTIAIDVMGHELTHGVTAHQANLSYHDQPGALNESVSDVFGSLVKQYAHAPRQTAVQADWLIGAGLFTAKVKGVALRSMKAPGTAYDDQMLGKDPQPAHMSAYVNTTSDNGGVHINSGIPNKAFYLLAAALGGYAWEKAGAIWYATICDARLSANAQFVDFANLTALNAVQLFGAVEQQAVINAWQQVGIAVAVEGPVKIFGNWILHYSWGPSSAYSTANITFNADGTLGGALPGKWVQQDGTLLMSFDKGPAKYVGTVDGNIGSGAMTTYAGLDGCWYLTKQGVTGVTEEHFNVSHGEISADGTEIAVKVSAVGR